MQDKKPDVPVSDDSNLVIVTTPEYVKDSIKEAIAEHAASRNHPDATLQDKGFVVLSNDVSDSETMAATPKAVKAAYDLADKTDKHAIGIGQKWTDVTSSRINGVWYTNDTDKPIVVYVESGSTNIENSPTQEAFSMGGEVDHLRVGYFWAPYGGCDRIHSFNFIVPPGSNYIVKAGWGNVSKKEGAIACWRELR
ncbi:tail fiber protein [Xenorhabdus sp. PB30.3]|uniref:tail fiber protein n=1 Tax=Xenorhabdus sp. PB30.3 TaxID=2788941 RepID=UPI001E4D0714|nr:phage tail protein [Xenorhabdus sp. PB30.3]MCC8381646.1 tail fiber protein [Xenorhabdus sp. PB30.3]